MAEDNGVLSDMLLDVENRLRQIREKCGTDDKEKREFVIKILNEIETKLNEKSAFPLNKMYTKAFRKCANETLIENL